VLSKLNSKKEEAQKGPQKQARKDKNRPSRWTFAKALYDTERTSYPFLIYFLLNIQSIIIFYTKKFIPPICTKKLQKTKEKEPLSTVSRL